jgi:PAS domain S-box-containing protein
VITGDTYWLELEMIRPDGTIRNVKAFGGARFDVTEDKITGLYGLVQDETAHKITERALLESEVSLEKVINTILETFSIIDWNGVVLFANTRAVDNLSGGKTKNIKGKNIREFVPAEQANQLIEVYRGVISTKQPVKQEIKITLSGSDKWFLNTLQYIQYGAGKTPGVVSISLEITERKHAEHELRLSEERNRLLSWVTIEGILIHLNGITKDFNHSLANMLGYEYEELLNKDFFEFIHPDDHDRMRENFIKEYSFPFEAKAIRKNGETFNIEIESRNFHHQDEKWRVSAIRDITHRKQVEELQRIMAEMLDIAPGSITVHDTNGHFLYANKKTFELHGYSESEFMSINLHNLDVPESEALLAERFRKIAETGNAKFDVSHYHKDGHAFPLEVYAKTVEWKGQPAVLSIATDITARKQAEKALIRSEKELKKAQ